ncbi:MAG: hypothetical protein Q9221_005781 [Calogaya cf. arnoldii]
MFDWGAVVSSWVWLENADSSARSSVVGSIIRVPLLAQLNPADASYTTVSSGLWLNVEISIGIVSACLPLLRPLVSRAFPSQLRSRFSKSHTGSHRLQDLEANNKGLSGPRSANNKRNSGRTMGHAKGLSDSGIYAGQERKQFHKNWLYNVKAGGSKNTRTGTTEGGSEEDMVPMGKIQVRHEVEWEREGDGDEGERTSEKAVSEGVRRDEMR